MNLDEIKDSMEYSFAMLYQEVAKIIGQLEEAQKTLEWYAEDRNWSDGELQRIEYPEVIVTIAEVDSGQRARDTLKRLKGATQ